MRRRKHWVCLLLVGVLLTLTACVTEYERSDIEKMLQDTYGLQEFTVAKEPVEWEDDKGYTDYYWKVTLQDGSGLTFGVLDDHYWGMESTTNSLRTDYEDVMLLQFAKEYTGFQNIQIQSQIQEGMQDTWLRGRYANRDQLQALFDELFAFQDYVTQRGYQVEHSFPFVLEMDSPLRSIMEGEGELSYTVTDGDYRGTLTGLEEKERGEATTQFIRACADYRFEVPLADFSSQEIGDALEGSSYRLGIYPSGEEEGEPVLYEDLSASNYAYGVSFGSLYEVLCREGFSVEGDSGHYRFTGVGGDVYEVSYDFYGENPQEPQAPNYYYYTKNGEVVWMDHYFYNHFTLRQVREMTGLQLYIGP